MHKPSLRQAWERLHRAEAALQRLDRAHDVRAQKEAWSDFLNHSGAVYLKLESGARGHPRASPWFGRKHHERDRDPLLTYLHHARNMDQHGRDEPARAHLGRLGIGGGGHYILNGEIGAGRMNMRVDVVRGPPPVVVNEPARFELTEATNRGQVYPVPTQHLGQAIGDPSAGTLGKLALAYLRATLLEAGRLFGNEEQP